MSERKKKFRPILCLDFDGVLHSYVQPWMGASSIPDDPVPGAMEFLTEAVKHFEVAVFSSRSKERAGIVAMQSWIAEHHPWGETMVRALTWPTDKPAAKVTIDDRAITFQGEWPSMDDLQKFEPWNKKDQKK
jgi:hypothetical protein